jgi:hypothetical protein
MLNLKRSITAFIPFPYSCVSCVTNGHIALLSARQSAVLASLCVHLIKSYESPNRPYFGNKAPLAFICSNRHKRYR